MTLKSVRILMETSSYRSVPMTPFFFFFFVFHFLATFVSKRSFLLMMALLLNSDLCEPIWTYKNISITFNVSTLVLDGPSIDATYTLVHVFSFSLVDACFWWPLSSSSYSQLPFTILVSLSFFFHYLPSYTLHPCYRMLLLGAHKWMLNSFTPCDSHEVMVVIRIQQPNLNILAWLDYLLDIDCACSRVQIVYCSTLHYDSTIPMKSARKCAFPHFNLLSLLMNLVSCKP